MIPTNTSKFKDTSEMNRINTSKAGISWVFVSFSKMFFDQGPLGAWTSWCLLVGLYRPVRGCFIPSSSGVIGNSSFLALLYTLAIYWTANVHFPSACVKFRLMLVEWSGALRFLLVRMPMFVDWAPFCLLKLRSSHVRCSKSQFLGSVMVDILH